MEVLKAGTVYTVNITAELPDTDPLDGIAQAANGACTLRAAVMQANYFGGGEVYANFSSTGGSLEMDYVIVRSNRVASGGVGAGGGIYADTGLAYLLNTTVANNRVQLSFGLHPGTGTLQYHDASSPGLPQRFYRLLYP